MRNVIWFLLVVLVGIIFPKTHVAADWWGDGARSVDWIIARGGVVIRYTIIANGAEDRYKAVLYRQNGNPMEWENGKTGRFDDPTAGTYVVKAFKGGVDDHKPKTWKGGTKILDSGPFTVRSGEIINMTLNDLTNEVSIISSKPAVAVRQ